MPISMLVLGRLEGAQRNDKNKHHKVSRYKAHGLCPSTLDTVPKPAGTIVHSIIQPCA